MKKERRVMHSKELRVSKSEDKTSVLSGYAAVYDVLSEDLGGFREKIAPGAFTTALGKSDCRALFNHNSNFILGRQSAGTLKLSEDDTGLYMEDQLPDTQYARDLEVSVERRDITQQSFGFIVKKDSWEENRETKEVIRTIIEIDELFDVSPVTFPAYPDTTIAKRSLEQYQKSANGGGENNRSLAFRKKEDDKREKYLKILKRI